MKDLKHALDEDLKSAFKIITEWEKGGYPFDPNCPYKGAGGRLCRGGAWGGNAQGTRWWAGPAKVTLVPNLKVSLNRWFDRLRTCFNRFSEESKKLRTTVECLLTQIHFCSKSLKRRLAPFSQARVHSPIHRLGWMTYGPTILLENSVLRLPWLRKKLFPKDWSWKK